MSNFKIYGPNTHLQFTRKFLLELNHFSRCFYVRIWMEIAQTIYSEGCTQLYTLRHKMWMKVYNILWKTDLFFIAFTIVFINAHETWSMTHVRYVRFFDMWFEFECMRLKLGFFRCFLLCFFHFFSASTNFNTNQTVSWKPNLCGKIRNSIALAMPFFVIG